MNKIRYFIPLDVGNGILWYLFFYEIIEILRMKTKEKKEIIYQPDLALPNFPTLSMI